MTMESSATQAAHTAPPIQPPCDDGLLNGVQAVWEDWRGIAHAHMHLLGLEAQRAGESLSAILKYGLLIGMLLFGAWLALAVALVWWLTDFGCAPPLALLLVALLNSMGVIRYSAALRRRSQYLRFPATMRSLQKNGQPPEQKELF